MLSRRSGSRATRPPSSPSSAYLDDATLLAIAAENNLSETAFLEPTSAGWNLRWFTPTVEVPLCGHATLASAWVVFERLARERTEVRSRRAGAASSVFVAESAGHWSWTFPAAPSFGSTRRLTDHSRSA